MKIFELCMLFTFTALFLLSCDFNKGKVEIVPNLESLYLYDYIAEVPAKEKAGFKAKAEKDLLDAVRTLDAEAPLNFNIAIRVYINEEGKVDKIKDISGDYRLNRYTDTLKNYKKKDKLLEAVAAKMSSWQFEPAKDKGENVKCWNDLKVDILKKSDGTYKIDMPGFLTELPDMNLFIPVDKMPQVKTPVTPKYPEQAKRSGIEGTVYVKLYVSKEGKPSKSIVIRSDNEIFNQPALDAAMQFEFTPAVRDDRALGVWVVVPFKFKLDK